MGLSSKQRYVAFFIGVGLGCLLITIYFQVMGAPHAPEPPDPGVIRRQVPGAVLHWVADSKPITGDFILSQLDSRKAGGSGPRFYRALVVPGLDQGAYILILEYSMFDNPDQVVEWKFMFADHVRAQLQPGTDTQALGAALAKLGWRFDGGKDKDGWVTIVLNEHAANSEGKAELQLQQWPQWVAKTAPDELPMPALTGAGALGI